MSKLHFGVAIAALLVAGAANAADLPIVGEPGPAIVNERVSGAFDWTGPYLGLYTGYNWNDGKISGISGKTDLDGVIVGATAGYNFQFDSVVLGVEADFGYNDANTRAVATDGGVTVRGKYEYDWNGTVRARAGYAFDRYLPYVTGGYAYGRSKVTVSATDGVDTVRAKDTKWGDGWVVGGGLEAAVTEQITVKGEYLYSEVDTKFGGAKINVDGHTAKVGLNYKFSWE